MRRRLFLLVAILFAVIAGIAWLQLADDTQRNITSKPGRMVAAAREKLGRRTGTFRGHYSTGFEKSAFVPCGSTETWWLKAVPSVHLCPAPDAYIEVHGVHSGRGQYGHLGRYQREIEIDAVLVCRPAAPSDCSVLAGRS